MNEVRESDASRGSNPVMTVTSAGIWLDTSPSAWNVGGPGVRPTDKVNVKAHKIPVKALHQRRVGEVGVCSVF